MRSKADETFVIVAPFIFLLGLLPLRLFSKSKLFHRKDRS